MTKRPSTIVVSVRCDLRDLTVIALWLNDQQKLPESIGSLGRKSIELLSDMIRKKNPTYSKMTTAEALSLLNQMGLKRGERNQFSLVKRLELEDAVMELNEPSKRLLDDKQLDDIMSDVMTRSSNYSKEEMDKITNQLGGTVKNGSNDEFSPDGEGNKPNK